MVCVCVFVVHVFEADVERLLSHFPPNILRQGLPLILELAASAWLAGW